MKRRTRNAVNTILGMTEKDVAANKQGKLSPRQKKGIQYAWYRAAVISSTVLVVTLVSISLSILEVGVNGGQDDSVSSFTCFACFGSFLFLYSGFCAFQNWKMLSNPPHIESVTGQVSKHSNWDFDDRIWYIVVGEQRLQVKKNIFDAFSEGNWVYTVYYIPPNRILSVVEELDG